MKGAVGCRELPAGYLEWEEIKRRGLEGRVRWARVKSVLWCVEKAACEY